MFIRGMTVLPAHSLWARCCQGHRGSQEPGDIFLCHLSLPCHRLLTASIFQGVPQGRNSLAFYWECKCVVFYTSAWRQENKTKENMTSPSRPFVALFIHKQGPSAHMLVHIKKINHWAAIDKRWAIIINNAVNRNCINMENFHIILEKEKEKISFPTDLIISSSIFPQNHLQGQHFLKDVIAQ